MISIVREMSSGFRVLFPAGRFRFLLIVLAMLGAVISVSELLVMKFFMGVVTREGEIERNRFIALGAGILIFFLTTRLAQYYQRVYRVRAFGRAFKGLRKTRKKGAGNPEWAMAFELSSVLTHATQLGAILLFFVLLEPYFALFNLAILVLVLIFIARLFIVQIELQQLMRTERNGKQARPERRYGQRIKAAETGALASGAGMIILLAALLYLSYNGDISLTNTLIFFLGSRLQNGSLTNISRSLMRYAKAKAGVSARADEDE